MHERIPKRQCGNETSAHASAEVVAEEWHDGRVMPDVQQRELPRLLSQYHEQRVAKVQQLAAVVDEHPELDSGL